MAFEYLIPNSSFAIPTSILIEEAYVPQVYITSLVKKKQKKKKREEKNHK